MNLLKMGALDVLSSALVFLRIKIKVKESQKKFLTFSDLCANMMTESQRKSKSKINLTLNWLTKEVIGK